MEKDKERSSSPSSGLYSNPVLAEIRVIKAEISDTTDPEPGLGGQAREEEHVCPAGLKNTDTQSQTAPPSSLPSGQARLTSQYLEEDYHPR